MSCFIVSREHIRVLVFAAAHPGKLDCYRPYSSPLSYTTPNGGFRTVTGDQEAVVGQMLLEANVRSVNDRYDEEELLVYDHGTPARTNYTPAEIIKAAHCFAYQACDATDWETSEAKAFVNALISRMSSELPGYEEAAWGIPDPAAVRNN